MARCKGEGCAEGVYAVVLIIFIKLVTACRGYRTGKAAFTLKSAAGGLIWENWLFLAHIKKNYNEKNHCPLYRHHPGVDQRLLANRLTCTTHDHHRI